MICYCFMHEMQLLFVLKFVLCSENMYAMLLEQIVHYSVNSVLLTTLECIG